MAEWQSLILGVEGGVVQIWTSQRGTLCVCVHVWVGVCACVWGGGGVHTSTHGGWGLSHSFREEQKLNFCLGKGTIISKHLSLCLADI